MKMLPVLVDVVTYSHLDGQPALLAQVYPGGCEHGAVNPFPERLHAKRRAAEVLGKRTIVVTLYQEEGIVGIAHELAYRTRFHGCLLIVKERFGLLYSKHKVVLELYPLLLEHTWSQLG